MYYTKKLQVCFIVGLVILLNSKFALPQIAFAQSSFTPTQLQLLLGTLQNLQSQLAYLQGVQPSTTVAALVSSGVIASSSGYDIIVIAGQSNSVGKGQGKYIEDLQYSKNKNLIFQLGRFQDHNLTIIPVTHEPLEAWGTEETYSSTVNGLRGFVYPFALRYASTITPGRKVLIIPAGKGSTSLLDWDKAIDPITHLNLPDSTLLFDDMVSRIKTALAMNAGNRVVAVLWQQGEADTTIMYSNFPSLTPFMSSGLVYQKKLSDLRSNVRNALSDQGCVPFLFGQMAREWVPDPVKNQVMTGLAAKSQVTDAIRAVVANDPCSTSTSAFVPSVLATSNANAVHFNALGQQQMAKNYWNAFQKMK